MMSTKHDTRATPGATNHTDPSPSIHDDFSQAQQRFWTEWADAGRLWMSWWMNSLPSVGWPPVGTVLPPAPSAPLKTEASGNGSNGSGDLSAHQHPETPPKHTRASGARHH
jgi:hypothetical protein